MPYELFLVSIAISTVALIVSLVTLWKSHISKFNPLFAVGDAALRIYPIINGEKKWFIPSIMIPVSISNSGARQGMISELRLSLNYIDLPIAGNYEIFRAKWEVDPSKYHMFDKNRFSWISEITIGNWMPYVILPKTTVTKYWIFEGHWMHPIIHQNIEVKLEAMVDNEKKWKKVAKWKVCMNKSSWHLCTENASAVLSSPEGCERKSLVETNPPDLHTYLRPHHLTSPVNLDLKSSYLDYPSEKE